MSSRSRTDLYLTKSPSARRPNFRASPSVWNVHDSVRTGLAAKAKPIELDPLNLAHGKVAGFRRLAVDLDDFVDADGWAYAPCYRSELERRDAHSTAEACVQRYCAAPLPNDQSSDWFSLNTMNRLRGSTPASRCTSSAAFA